MALRRRRGKWHYRFEINGHEWTGSTGLVATEHNRKPAERIELEAKQTIEQGKSHLLKIQTIPFTEAADKFLSWCQSAHRKKPNTWRRVKTSFASLLVHFGRTPLNAITQGDVSDYAAWRANEHKVKDVTIRHDLHSLSKFFKYALKHNWCRDNPVTADDIPSDEDAVRIYVFTERGQSEYLLAAERYPKLHDLTSLMLYQGCRPEELLSLEVSDVDLERRYLRIRGGKTRSATRDLRVRPESLPTLARLVREAKGQYIFFSERNPQKKLSLSTCENWHVKVRESTGIPCVIYDWRHTFATRAANQGMSLATLKDILGHASLRSVMRYVHPSQNDQDRAMERLSIEAHTRTETGPRSNGGESRFDNKALM